MKKFKNIVLKVLMCLVMLLTFASCKAPAEMCGRYNLTSISGIPGVSVSTYEYNYIELYDDYSYTIENKIYGTVTTQTGEWSINDEKTEITFITKVNASTMGKDVAQYDYEAKTITLTSKIQNQTISMVLTLQVESEEK